MKTCKQTLLIHPESFTVTWKTIQISFLFYLLYCVFNEDGTTRRLNHANVHTFIELHRFMIIVDPR